ncbi:hypothetical protein CHU_1647 [Sporocytophaga myxococcoides]|uniref:DUF7619 domain-containing protein n=2 Tax=Sporocytophaga myxococcoides TaxID=153721 RepID=A0A098LI02_9BACT|nr:hypothetical protein CHU_1647 [Sporocytophaga myxococcoides]
MFRLIFFFIFSLSQIIAFSQTIDTSAWTTNGAVKSVVKNGNTIYIGGEFSYIGLNTGNAVPVNINTGKPLDKYPKVDGAVICIAEDGRGGYFLGGMFTNVGGQPRKNIAHINRDLQVTDWHAEVNNTIVSIAVTSTSVIIGGAFTDVSGVSRNNFAELTKTTGSVTSFNPDPNGRVASLLIDGNSLYIGGSFDQIGGKSRTLIACFSIHDYSLKNWSPLLEGSTNEPRVTQISRKGNTLYFSGHFYKVNGEDIYNTVGVDTISGHSNIFKINGYNTSWRGTDIMELNDSLVIIGSGWTDWNSDTLSVLAYNIKTGSQTKFPKIHGSANKIRLVGDNLYIAGYPNFKSPTYIEPNFSCINIKTGEYREKIFTANHQFHDFVIKGDIVYTGGNFTSINGKNRYGLAALDANTHEVLDWNFSVSSGYNYFGRSSASSLKLYNNTLFVGGMFDHIYGDDFAKRKLRFCIAQIDLATNAITDWDIKLGGYCGDAPFVEDFFIKDNLVYVVGNWTSANNMMLYNNGYTTGIAAFDLKTGAIDPNWKPIIVSKTGTYTTCNAESKIRTFTSLDDKLLIGGSLISIGGQNKYGFAAIDPKNGELISWGPDLTENSEVYKIIVGDNKIYLAGQFGITGYPEIKNYAELDFDGNVLSSPYFNDKVTDISINDNSIFAIGDFTSINGVPVSKAAVINRLDYSVSGLFQEILYSDFKPVTLQYLNGSLYMGGNFTMIGSTYSPYFAVIPLESKPVYKITGRIFHDLNGDCIYNDSDKPFANMVVKLKPINDFRSTDENGFYSFSTTETGTYEVEQLPSALQQKLEFKSICPSNINTRQAVVSADEPIADNIQFANTIKQCAFLSIDIASDRRRRCFRNNTTVTYCNSGNVTSGIPLIKVIYPEYVVPVSSSKPWLYQSGDTLFFSGDQLEPGQCNSIYLVDSVICGKEEIRGMMQCTEAIITPANNCIAVDPKWDRSDLILKASCRDNGYVRVSLINIGSGNMSDSSGFRVFLNATIAYSKKVKLVSGDSIVLNIPANGKMVRAEADQLPYHPLKNQPSVTIEGCGSGTSPISYGYAALFNQDDRSEDVESFCMEIRDSYDPNDKSVYPIGLFDQHFIKNTEELEYLIRFKNKGTDTAYTVVIHDTLSTHLDLYTLSPGASSHEYTYELRGKESPVLIIRFRNINLVDSITNDAKSGGFFKFKISPKKDLPEWTVLSNKAGIYFDYNSAIITNEVTQIIKDTSYTDLSLARSIKTGEVFSICQGDTISVKTPLASSYHWTPNLFIDATDSQNPLFFPKETEEFTLALETGGKSKEITYTIVVNPLPEIKVSNDTIICKGDTIQLSATGANEFIWDTKNILSKVTQNQVVVFPQSSTRYLVEGINSFKCSGFDTISVTVKELPDIQVSKDTTICKGDTIYVTASGAQTYQWFLNTNSLAGNSELQISPVKETIYDVTGKDQYGCSTNKSVKVSIDSVFFTIPAELKICKGDTAKIELPSTYTYNWSNGLSVRSLSSSAYLFPLTTTQYEVTGINDRGCMSKKIFGTEVKELPHITTSKDTSICNGTATALSAAGGVEYKWYLNATKVGDKETLNVSPYNSSDYKVMVRGANECSDFRIIHVEVKNLPDIIIRNDTTIFQGDTIDLAASSFNATFQGWTPSIALMESWSPLTKANPEHSIVYTATYMGSNGCLGKDSLEIKVKPKNFQKDFEIRVQPNPFNTNAEFYINSLTHYSINSPVVIKVCDSQGRLVAEIIHSSRQNPMLIPFEFTAKPGLYYYSVNDNSGVLGKGKFVSY